jgi:hypothetical protein
MGPDRGCRNKKLYRGDGALKKAFAGLSRSVKPVDSNSVCHRVVLAEDLPSLETPQTFKLSLPSKINRVLEFDVNNVGKLKLNLEFELAKGASLGLSFIGRLPGAAVVDIDVKSYQNEPGSNLYCVSRLVCPAGTFVNFDTSGYLGDAAEGAICRYDLKFLQIGTGGKVTGVPVMEVLRRDVVASHGFSVGTMPHDVLQYMQSRGITKNEAEDLFIKGFLRV